MVEKLNIDDYSRSIISERDICKRLYLEPKFDYNQVVLQEPEKYNSSIDQLYSDLPKLKKLDSLDLDPIEWHKQNQNIWFMPEEYKSLDIAKWLLDRCANETELQRVGEELLLYQERELFDLLRYLKYLVDTMVSNNIVWGVGRGSSVASFVLYLIGIHHINSITYNLDPKEFLR